MSDDISYGNPISRDNQYFAKKEPNACAGVLISRAQSFFNILRSNAYLEKLQRMWRAYFGAYNDDVGYGHKINFVGEQGELVSFPVNHFRNLAQHMYVMITSNRPVMEARALNTDYKSLSQTYLAAGILEYYMREKHLEDCLTKAVELAIVLGAGFVKLSWNATAGEVYDVDEATGAFNYEGDIEFTNLTPLDVIVDGTKESWEENDWFLVRTFKNRHDIIAKYPELEQKILGLPSKIEGTTYRLGVFSNDETDDIPVYEFYHKRTECMPDGRYMLFVDSDVVLLDTKLPYRTIPIFRISAGDILGTPYGYSPMFDVFPVQECMNSLYSSIMTNNNAFGVQNIWVPRGSDIAVNQLEGNMNVIESDVKPEPLNLTQTAPELFKFLESLVQTAETLSGVNSVARGNPEASLKSGTALALVQSMALQFMSGLQQSYVKLIEGTGTSLIQILKDFAATPRVVNIVGKNNKSFLKEFTGEEISAINRVIVDMGNPLSRTTAGRVQMAEQLLQMNLLKSPEQYFEVMNTGKLETTFEGEMSELLLIKKENEQLMEGKAPLVAPTDSHSLHIMEHKSVLADPDLRQDATLVKAVMDHIEQHLNALTNTDPRLLQLIGQQALPPLQPPMPPGGPQGGPPGPEGQPPNPAPVGGPIPPEMSPAAGETTVGGQVNGPGVKNINPAKLPKVNGNLLPNPDIQQNVLGNLKK